MSLLKVLMERDEMTEEQAKAEINDARTELLQRIGYGESPFDFCEEWFGLEPDYLMELI